MSETTGSLLQKIGSATDLHGVVRTMKAVAASSVGQYESAVRSLDDYYHTVQLGLAACLRDPEMRNSQGALNFSESEEGSIIAIVFGSDQGLVGQFNEVMVDFLLRSMQELAADKSVWVVGERVGSRLEDSALESSLHFRLPGAIQAISPLIATIMTKVEALLEQNKLKEIYLFNNRPTGPSTYTPVRQRLLPLDAAWSRELVALPWPTTLPPQVINGARNTLPALIHEYLFVSIFRACAESLASENASRLAAMQRAEKNIDELLNQMTRSYHRLRKDNIDAELFDLIAGFESLNED